MKILPFLAIAIAAGALLPVQGSMNARLGQIFPHPLHASLVSFTGGTLTLLLIILLFRIGFPSLKQVSGIPLHLFFGGVIGAFFVSVFLILIPRLGVVGVGVTVIAGQLLFSMIIDHFGLLNMKPIPISFSRISGGILLLAGVLLMQKWN